VEHVRLRGTARRIGDGEGPLAGSCEVAVRHKKQRHVVDGRFELVGSDGKASIVEIAGAAVVGASERRGLFKDLAGEPGVAAIGIELGPLVELTLRTAWILDGKPIEVVGSRDGETLKAVAAGPDTAVDAWEAEKARNDKLTQQLPKVPPPIPWNAIVPIALVVITIALAEVAVTIGGLDLEFVRPSIAITLAAVAVGLLWNQIGLPKFDERETKTSFAVQATAAVIVGIGINLPPEGPVGTTIIGAVVLAVTVFGLVRERPIIRIMRSLAAPATPPEDGKSGVFVGSVGDKTPAQFFSQLIAIGTVHTVRRRGPSKGYEKTIVTERKGFDSTFQLSVGKDEIDIDPTNALWSSELRDKHETWSVFIPLKAEVVATGTPRRDGGKLTLKSTGGHSLAFYAVAAGQDPQAWLRRKLLLHKLTYGSAFMVVALATGLALHGFIAGG
jgi:hypothetical protein